MLKLFSTLVVALCVASALVRSEDEAATPCTSESYVAPAFDAINFIETISYHNTKKMVGLFQTIGVPGDFRLLDLLQGKVYASFSNGTCVYYANDPSLNLAALAATAKNVLTVDNYQNRGPIKGYEMGIDNLQMRTVQRTSDCASLFYSIVQNGIPRMAYFYTSVRPASDADLQLIEDAIAELSKKDCKQGY